MVNIWPIIAQLLGSGCPLCGFPGDGLCRRCTAALPYNRHPCPRCALPLPESAPPESLCARCQARPPGFDRAVAPLLYVSPVDDLVSGLKYHRRLALGRILGDLVADTLADGPGGRSSGSRDWPQLLLPIPAARARLRGRGFNQAAELASGIGRRLGIQVAHEGLSRVRDADPQRGLNARQRRRNLRGAFSCGGRLPARVALVDDVITTGATADEASRALKHAGVEMIELWAVARTPLEGYRGP